MITTPQSSMAQVRQKLEMAFDDSSLSAFCLNYFPTVYNKFSGGMRKDEKVTLLLDHCRRYPTGFETLLNNVREAYVLSNFQREQLKPLIDALSVYIGSSLEIADTAKDEVGSGKETHTEPKVRERIISSNSAQTKKASFFMKTYNLKNIRLLLWHGFDVEDLRDFCLYSPHFEILFDELPQGDGKKRQIIREIIKFGNQKGKLSYLLEWAKKENPVQYQKFSLYWDEELLPTDSVTPRDDSKPYPTQPDSNLNKTSDQEVKKEKTFEFDVFLAHNSNDKPLVRVIAEELRQRHLSPWLDEEQIPPGRWFQDVIQQAIATVKSAAIFIGPNGMGKWQIAELRTFISKCVNTGIAVIPVLLPSVDQIPEELLFIQELNWVRFDKGIYDVETLDRLEWGITGKKPSK